MLSVTFYRGTDNYLNTCMFSRQIVNKSCNMECCGNKMQQIVPNVIMGNYTRLVSFILDRGRVFKKLFGHLL